MLLAIGILLAGSLAAGVLPDAGQAFAHAARRFTDAAEYISQVLSHAGAAPPRPDPAAWTGEGIRLDVLSAALALGVAFFALYAQRLPGALRRLARPARAGYRRRPPGALGHIGDYVAWLFTGIAGLAANTPIPGVTDIHPLS